MRVLLTHGYSIAEDVREQSIMRPYAPLGILYISGWLEKNDIPHEVIDATFLSQEEQWSRIVEFAPDAIGIYVNLMTRRNVIQLIKRLRSDERFHQTKIILGGPEVRNHAENWLRSGADVLVVGEGEITFHHLITSWSDTSSLYKIPGIYFSDGNGIHFTGEREKIKDIDCLPFPNRKKIDLHQYLDVWKKHHGKNAISISSMRGCPYTCKWCSRAVYGLSYRRRSPKLVVEEMKYIQENYHPDTLWFVDDVFTISHKWLEEFTSQVKQSGISLPYECITRADRLNADVISLLKQSGCYRIWIGAESGSQRIIDAMDRRVEVNQVREMIKMARANGIEAGTFIMLGYPGETEADIMETVHHLITSSPDYFTITTAYPIKGTELYQEVEEDITYKPDWSVSSDRDIKFKRSYNDTYYKYAVRYVVNSVNYAQQHKMKFKAKAVAARSGMYISRIFG